MQSDQEQHPPAMRLHALLARETRIGMIFRGMTEARLTYPSTALCLRGR